MQVWLALNNLVVDSKCRAKYELDDYRKNTLLKLKRFMNELLFDQVPVLKDLQRVLDETALNVGSSTTAHSSGQLILEQVRY
jgi:zinc finger MYND domain-containing protein 10